MLSTAYLVRRPRYTELDLYVFSMAGQLEATDVYLVAAALQKQGFPAAPRLVIDYKRRIKHPFITSLTDSIPSTITVRGRKIELSFLQKARFLEVPEAAETIRWLYRFALESKFTEMKEEMGYEKIAPGKYYFNKVFPPKKMHKIGVFHFKPYDEISILPIANGRVVITHNKRTRVEAEGTIGELVQNPSVEANLKRQARINISKVKFVHLLSNRGLEPISIEFCSPRESVIPEYGKTVIEAMDEFWREDPLWREKIKPIVEKDIGYFIAIRMGFGSSWYRAHRYGVRYIPFSVAKPLLLYENTDFWSNVYGLPLKDVNKKYREFTITSPMEHITIAEGVMKFLKENPPTLGDKKFEFTRIALTTSSEELEGITINILDLPPMMVRRRSDHKLEKVYLDLETGVYMKESDNKEELFKYTFRKGGFIGTDYVAPYIPAWKGDRAKIGFIYPEGESRYFSQFKIHIWSRSRGFRDFLFGSPPSLEPLEVEEAVPSAYETIIKESQEDYDAFLALLIGHESDLLHKVARSVMFSQNIPIQCIRAERCDESYIAPNLLAGLAAKAEVKPFKMEPPAFNFGRRNPIILGVDIRPLETDNLAAVVACLGPDFSSLKFYAYSFKRIPGIIIPELGDMIRSILKAEAKEASFDHVWLLRDGPVLRLEQEDFREAMLAEGYDYVLAGVIGMGGGRILRFSSNAYINPHPGTWIRLDSTNALLVPHFLPERRGTPQVLRLTLAETNIKAFDITDLVKMANHLTFIDYAFTDPGLVREPLPIRAAHKAAEAVAEVGITASWIAKNGYYCF